MPQQELAPIYAPPVLEVLGRLTDLAEGAEEGGPLIVMQSFPPTPGEDG